MAQEEWAGMTLHFYHLISSQCVPMSVRCAPVAKSTQPSTLEGARLDEPPAQCLGLHAWRLRRGLACHCDLSCGGKWHTATLGLSGPSCPTWATASVMAVSE